MIYSRTTAENKLYMRQWRLSRNKNLKLERISKVKRKFFEGYWDVAGKFFAVKSALNPQIRFNPLIPLTKGIEYKGAREGYETWKQRN